MVVSKTRVQKVKFVFDGDVFQCAISEDKLASLRNKYDKCDCDGANLIAKRHIKKNLRVMNDMEDKADNISWEKDYDSIIEALAYEFSRGKEGIEATETEESDQ